jgi:hypothetical protein
MLKQVFIGAVFIFCAAGIASAQSTTTNTAQQPAAAAPTTVAMVSACVNQVHRLAGLNKALAANYNPTRVHEDCVARVGTTTDIAAR